MIEVDVQLILGTLQSPGLDPDPPGKHPCSVLVNSFFQRGSEEHKHGKAYIDLCGLGVETLEVR